MGKSPHSPLDREEKYLKWEKINSDEFALRISILLEVSRWSKQSTIH